MLLQWNQDHPAWKLLFDEIVKGNIPLDEAEMGPAEVYCNYNRTFEFELRGMEWGNTFVHRLKSLREIIARDRDRASDDLEALKISIRLHPVPLLNRKGKLQWNGSIAQRLLKQDIEAGLNKSLTPSEMYETRCGIFKQYLDLKDFCDKIHQVVRTKKYLHMLEHRAQQKLKAYVKVKPSLDEQVTTNE